jgi:HNH endonuclease
MSAELRTALELGPPPTFEGAVCSEEGCDRRYGLEWDHVDPVANGGGSNDENLQALCAPHHWTKTEGDRKAGLLGGGRAPPVSR